MTKRERIERAALQFLAAAITGNGLPTGRTIPAQYGNAEINPRQRDVKLAIALAKQLVDEIDRVC